MSKLKGILQNEFIFYGTHAEKVLQLTSKKDNETGIGYFSSNVKVLESAALLGTLLGKKAKENKTEVNTKIFLEAMLNHKNKLQRAYSICLLMDQKDLPVDTRVKNAFMISKDVEKQKYHDQVFYEYALGGVDALYEMIYGENGAEPFDQQLRNIEDFICVLDQIKGEDIKEKEVVLELSEEDILELAKGE